MIPNIWKSKSHVPNHQPDQVVYHKSALSTAIVRTQNDIVLLHAIRPTAPAASRGTFLSQQRHQAPVFVVVPDGAVVVENHHLEPASGQAEHGVLIDRQTDRQTDR